MANVLAELFANTADAIREKTGDAGTMKPAEFPEKIRAIETGGGVANIITLTITENGKYDVRGYATADVQVESGASVGDLVKFFVNYEEPVVNSATSCDAGTILSVSIGDNAIVSGSAITDSYATYISIAEGCTITIMVLSEEAAFYICELNDQSEFTSVQEIDLDSEYDSENSSITFTIPEVDSGKYLVKY